MFKEPVPFRPFPSKTVHGETSQPQIEPQLTDRTSPTIEQLHSESNCSFYRLETLHHF